MSGQFPAWMLSGFVAVTLFVVMFSSGLGIALGELRWIWRRPGPTLRGLFSVLIAVPALALMIVQLLELPRLAEIGILLMAISPGAPVALHRSLAAGGHPAFAPTLQISAVLLAVISMPLSIAALDHLYAGEASIAPLEVARQVFVAQLLPLGLGIALRQANVAIAARVAPGLKRIGTMLLIVTVVLILIDVWEVTVTAGLRVLAAIALITGAALAIGHLLGGPEPAMRTAVAITSAARNAGLALLVATLNAAAPAINAAILAYLVVSALATVPYGIWRRQAAARVASGIPPK